MTTISEPFDGSGDLGANWGGAVTQYKRASGQLSATDGAIAVAYWAANTFPGGQFVQFTVKAVPSAPGTFGPGGVLKYDPVTGYYYYFAWDASRIFVVRVFGSITVPYDTNVSGPAVSISVNDVLTFEAKDGAGGSLDVAIYKNGTQILTFNDAAPLTGQRIGLRAYYGETASRLDDYSGGDLVASGPTINTQPANQTVTAPAPATFSISATASGGGTLGYQWKLNGSNVGTNSSSLTTGATSVTGGTWNNGDSITCVVTETGGTSPGSITSSAATLTVNAGGGSGKPGLNFFRRPRVNL